uniref:Reverse transcriptase zinc-binding domain-containing protein n=1 Tax=Cannabis sativa TaxID=3483 RepID=A0A803PI13_CANSA
MEQTSEMGTKLTEVTMTQEEIGIGGEPLEPPGDLSEAGKQTQGAGDVDEMRQQFLESMTLNLEADVELSAEVTRKGVLAKTFGRRTVARGRVKEILSKIWKLEGAWRLKTMKLGLWGIFFNENDKKELTWENTDVIARKVGEYIDFDRAPRATIARRGLLKFEVDILLNQRLVAGHCYGKCDRPLEYAYPPIGKAVPLYGAWIKVGVPIKNCFDPAIPRMKVPETKLPYAVEKPPEEGRGKGKMVMLEDESDGSEARRQWPESQRPVGVRLSPKQKMVHGAKKACLREQEKMNNLGNMGLRSVPNSKKHPMTKIDNKRRDEGIIASLMADIGPTRDQMVDRPHEEVCKSRVPHQFPEPTYITWPTDTNLEEVIDKVLSPTQSKKGPSRVVVSHDNFEFSSNGLAFSGAKKKRKACVNVIPGSFSHNGESSKRKSKRPWRWKGSFVMKRGTKQSRSLVMVVEKGKTINEVVGIGAGFALLWNEGVDLELIKVSNGIFQVLIKEPLLKVHWMLFTVYGRPYETEKQLFSEELEKRINKVRIPWVVIGDLNVIVHPWEKSGGRRVTARDTWIFTNFLQNTGGVDLGFHGCKFTWQNNRFLSALTRERLDRAMVLGDWITSFLEAKVTNAPISVSDHGYVLLDTVGGRKRGFKPFRFFEAWSRDQSCEDIIKGSRDLMIKAAEERLGWIQGETSNASLLIEELELQSKISELWIRKESMWRQRSREIWLKVGDRNSKFFHASTIIRRRRNEMRASADGDFYDLLSPTIWMRRNENDEKCSYGRGNMECGGKMDCSRPFSLRIGPHDKEEERKGGLMEIKLDMLKALVKSSVLFSKNVETPLKTNILNVLKVKECDGNEKHLGNPFVFKRKKRDEYMFLKEKVLKRIEGWKTKLLSFAGRTTLVKSVALSIVLYVMSTNRLPLSTSRDLDKVIRRFCWTGDSEKERFMALVGWGKLCSRIMQGGLGFRKMEDMNKALLAKLAWQMASNFNRPWVKCLSEKYCKKDSFWSIQARDKYSAFWKGILGSADIIRKGAMTLVGRGDTIDIWKQPWIPWLDYCDFLNLMNQVRPRFPNLRSIADITLDNGNWNMTLLKEMFGDSVGDRIGRIARLPLDNRDVVVWKEANDGMFTVKRGFEASQGNGQRVESKLWKKIWSSSVHFRHSIMLWRVILDCLPTRERLVFLQDKTWSMCGEATKSNTHIFWDCPCARALWFSSPFSIRGGIGFDWSIQDRLEWLLDRNPSEHSASFLSFVGCLFKGIWKARNELLFKGGVVNIQQIRNSIMRRYSESFLSMEADAALDATTPGVVSRQTICNNVEVFCVSDASWKEDKAPRFGLLDRHNKKEVLQRWRPPPLLKLLAINGRRLTFQRI